MAKRKKDRSGRLNVQSPPQADKNLSSTSSTREPELATPTAQANLNQVGADLAALNHNSSSQQSAVNTTSDGANAMQNVESNTNAEQTSNPTQTESSVDSVESLDKHTETQTQSAPQNTASASATEDKKSLSANATQENQVSQESQESVTLDKDTPSSSNDSNQTKDTAISTTSSLETSSLSSAAQQVSDLIVASTSGDNTGFDINTSLESKLITHQAPQSSQESATNNESAPQQNTAQEASQNTSSVKTQSVDTNTASAQTTTTATETTLDSADSTKDSSTAQDSTEKLSDTDNTENSQDATVFANISDMPMMDEGTDLSAMVASEMASQASGASIMNDAVLSNDGHTAIMGLENLQNPSKPKVNTHIIIGPNNERIISPIPEEEEDKPTPPRDLGFVQRLAEINAKKAEDAKKEAIREAQRKKDKEKALAEGQRVVNQTYKSLDDFDFGQARSREATRGNLNVPSNTVPKDLPQSSGMGNGIVSNILDNKDPFAGRENQPHDKFGSTVSDYDNPRLSQAEIARSRARLALAQDNLNQELEFERLKQRGQERREREQLEAKRREQERQRLELERFEQEKERRRQERLAQEQQRQELEVEANEMELSEQNMGGDAYVGMNSEGGVNNYNQPFAAYADPSEYEGIAAPITDDTPDYQSYDKNTTSRSNEFPPSEDSAPTYMVGNINRPQKEIVHTAMFVQGDGEEPSPYVCGVNARRLSDSDLRKFQQQQNQQSEQETSFATNQAHISNLEFVEPKGNDSFPPQNQYFEEQNSEQGYSDFNAPNAPEPMNNASVGANDFKLQPGFGDNLNFNPHEPNGLTNLAPNSYAEPYLNEQGTEALPSKVNQSAENTENLYWTPGQSTADLQAAIANQHRRMQQEQNASQIENYQEPTENYQGQLDNAAMANSQNATEEEERTEPLPTGMGDGALALNGSLEQQNLTAATGIDGASSQQSSGPVYMVGPSRPTNQRDLNEEEDDGPLYAVGPQRLNAQVEAKLQANLKRMNMRVTNPTPNQQQLTDEKALAEAARESIAAPQSEVIKRARQLAAQVSAEQMAANANLNASFNESDLIANDPELNSAAEGAYPDYQQQGLGENMAISAEPNPLNEGFASNQNLGFEYEDAAQSGFKSTLNAQMEAVQVTPEHASVQNTEIPLTSENVYSSEEGVLHDKNLNKEQISLGLMVVLYVRQLFASFFTHTTLPIFFPHLARKLGPCYPSSMAVPFFFVGLIAAFCGRGLAAVSPLNDGSGLTFLIYLGLTGLTAYRGFYRIGAYFNRHRRDVILLAASVCVPMSCFVWITNSLFASTLGIVEPTLAFAFASMLSAASASTLSWNVQQDPIDSCGSMTTKGLLLVIVVCFMAAFGLLDYIVGLSVLGVTFIMRLAFGFIIAKNHGTAHRSYINALQLLTFFAILLDLTLLKGQNYDLLSASTMDLVRYLDRLL